ncbi:hypothetical protein [Janthinobacterium sp. PSPC3-1]|uniref:hypothetical protein n=1 Tax=Janthinobacterium sp. PSPC3-1 TaxID=2804653 RepID=UPI003CED6B8A
MREKNAAPCDSRRTVCGVGATPWPHRQPRLGKPQAAFFLAAPNFIDCKNSIFDCKKKNSLHLRIFS